MLVITENKHAENIIRVINKSVPTKILHGAGIDLSYYKYREFSQDSLVITMISRLLYDKGVMDFVKAAKILKKKHKSLEIQLVGDIDPLNPASLNVSDLEILKNNDNISILGYRKDIKNIISNSAIIVLPSYHEGFPKVLIEAAACGRVIVTTDVPGCRDAIIPNETGLLVPVQNAKALASAIELLVLDKALRQQMGEAGRKLAEERYDINQVVKNHLDIYQKLLAIS